MDIILLVLGFSLIVLVHELGHFLAAKYVGIKCEQFALGFGPAIFAWRKGIGFRIGTTEKEYQRLLKPETEGLSKVDPASLGDTEYRFNWVPLGGYVKMMGQDDTKPGLVVNDPRSYTSKSVGQRMLVISAGVIMNIIFAFIAFMVLFMTGMDVPQAKVGGVTPMSPAQMAVRADGSAAPLQVGDEILAINGTPQHNDFRKIALNTALAEAGEPLKIDVRRVDGKIESLSVTPAAMQAGSIRLLGIGIGMPRKLEGPVLVNDAMRQEYAKLPAERQLLQPGDRITAINGDAVTVNEFWKLDAAMQASEGRPVRLTITPAKGQPRDAEIQPEILRPAVEAGLNFAGMVPRVRIEGISDKSSAKGKLEHGDIVLAVRVGGDATYDPTPDDFSERIKQAGSAGAKVTLTVLRAGKELTITDLDPNLRLDTKGNRGLGITHDYEQSAAVIARGLPNSPAADVTPGSTVKSVGGVAVQSWHDVLRELRKVKAGASIELQLAAPAGGEVTSRKITLRDQDASLMQHLRYDTAMELAQLTDSRRTNNPFVAAWWGVQETRDSILQVYLTLHRLFEGSVPFSGMMGPVGMFSVGTKVASQGLDYLLWFLAIISANLAVVNFLPVPVVDGGHFLFLTIEKIQGKPLSEKTMVVAQYIGLAMILTLFVAVTYQDILRMLTVH